MRSLLLLVFGFALVLLVGCGDDSDGSGGTDAGSDVGSDTGSGGDGGGGEVTQPEPPFAPTWSHLFGTPPLTTGAPNLEALLALEPAADGGVLGFAALRSSGSSPPQSGLLFALDSAGALTSVQSLFLGSFRFFAMAPGPDGERIIASDSSDLSLVSLDDEGAILWERDYTRDGAPSDRPEATDLFVASDGSVFLAGEYRGSESDRGFVARLDDSGEPDWMHSWDNDELEDPNGRVVVDGAGTVFVLDQLSGPSESSPPQPVLLTFSSSGDALAQRELTFSLSGNTIRLAQAALVPLEQGVLVVGLRRSILGESDDGLLVYGIELDADLAIVSQTATRVVTESNTFPITPFRVTGGGGAPLHAAISLEDRAVVLRLDAAGAVEEAYAIEDEAGEQPLLLEDELFVHLAPSPDGNIYIGATADDPGTIRLVPWATATFPAAASASDVEMTLADDALAAEDVSAVRLEAYEDAELDAPEANDADALILRIPPR